jgi:hypothetical protein
MSQRINDLLNFTMAALAPVVAPSGTTPAAGQAAAIVLGDAYFNRAASGEAGKYSLPLIGVAYAGSERDRFFDAGRQVGFGESFVDVFLLFRDADVLDADLRAHFALVDAVLDNLVGRLPVRVVNSGTDAAPVWAPLDASGNPYAVDSDGNLLLATGGAQVLIGGQPVWMLDLPDESANYQLLGNALIHRGDKPAPLSEANVNSGLSCWVVRFRVPNSFIPDRTNLSRDYPMDGCDDTLDPRPGETPPTPAGDLFPSEVDF